MNPTEPDPTNVTGTEPIKEGTKGASVRAPQIRIMGDPVLRAPNKRVEEITDDIRLLAKLLELGMVHEGGLGLAAPQIGVNLSVAVMNTSSVDAGEKLRVLINPEITHKSGWVVAGEGCLSIPGEFEEIGRYERVTVKYMEIDGTQCDEMFTGMTARAAQHEIDHLNGALIFDLLDSPLRRDMIRRKMLKIYKWQLRLHNADNNRGPSGGTARGKKRS